MIRENTYRKNGDGLAGASQAAVVSTSNRPAIQEAPYIAQEKSSAAQEKPHVTQEKPTDHQEKPRIARGRKPSAAQEKPGIARGTPSGTQKKPHIAREKPSVVQDKPHVVEEKKPFAARKKPRVALGMSGGVDSSVTAALLLQAGYDVLGVTCLFSDGSSSETAINDAKAVARVLGIPHVVHDCRETFEQCVVQKFVEGYACGQTPSPCVGCNAQVKIPGLIAAAREAAQEDGYPCDFVATGHYARIEHKDGRYFVRRAASTAKDQSYMLSLLTQDQLARFLTPLGHVAGGKPEVRRIAAELGLPTASKSESQDICFIPNDDYQAFLAQRGVSGKPGDIVTRDGKVVGHHNGLFRYTIGQRKGLGIGGAPKPYYVVEKEAESNRIVVAFEEESLIDSVQVSDMNWQAISPQELIRSLEENGSLACSVKLRYRQKAVPCRLALNDSNDSSITILLNSPQAPTAPGQFAVLYDGDAVLGAGMITSLKKTSC